MTESGAAFTYHQDAASIEALRNSQIMTYAHDVLALEARRIGATEDVLVKIGLRSAWDERRAAVHDVMSGVMLALDRILAKGKDQAQRGMKIDPLIGTIGEALKSSLISEMTRRSPDDRPADDGVAA